MYRFIFILFAFLYGSSQVHAADCPVLSNKLIGSFCEGKKLFSVYKVPSRLYDSRGIQEAIFLNKCAFFPFNIGKKKIYGSERTAGILSQDSVPWNNSTLRFIKEMGEDFAQKDQYEVKFCKYELRSNDDGTGRKKQAHMFVVGKKTSPQNKEMGNFVNTSQRSQSLNSSVPESFSPPPPPTYDNEMDKGFSTPYRGLNDDQLPPPPPSYHGGEDNGFNPEEFNPSPPPPIGLNGEELSPFLPPYNNEMGTEFSPHSSPYSELRDVPPPPPLFDDGLNYSGGVDGDFTPPPPPPSMDGFGGGNFAPPPPPLPSPNNSGERGKLDSGKKVKKWGVVQADSSNGGERGTKETVSPSNTPPKNNQGMFVKNYGEDFGNKILQRRADTREDEDQNEEELNMDDEFDSLPEEKNKPPVEQNRHIQTPNVNLNSALIDRISQGKFYHNQDHSNSEDTINDDDETGKWD